MSNNREPPSRCRLILVAPPEGGIEIRLSEALDGGDVAAVILAAGGMDSVEYARHCRELAALAQVRDIAAIAVDDTVVAGRSGADGLLLQSPGRDHADIVARFSPHKLVGFAGIFTRHRAIELGESQPDFLLFGKTDGDARPNAHPKNLALGEWWSKMIEIPCAVMAGNTVASIAESAACGAEFVVAGRAIFDHGDGPGEAVRLANALLDEQAENVVF